MHKQKATKFLRRLSDSYPHVLAIGQELVFVLMEQREYDQAEQVLRRFEKENPNTFESRLSRLASSSAVSAPKRSNAMRVRVVSGLGGLNLVKTPFELSRWRGGRCGGGFPRSLLAV